MTGTTDAVLAIFNAHHTSGQTEFDGVIFENNTADTNDASAVFAGAHSTFHNTTPSLGGIGWDTVKVSCNNFTGITTLDNGVRFFIPGVPDDEALGGASIDVTFNWWGTADAVAVEDLMQVPSITDFLPLLPHECSFDNLGLCISSLTIQNCSGLKGKDRAACNQEQQNFCFGLFGVGMP